MEVINSVSTLKAKVSAFRKDNKQIGLVPTMGALHNGHASLVSRSVKENDVTIVSVFVNPTQFNDKNDLEKYPRTLEADLRASVRHWCSLRQWRKYIQSQTLALSATRLRTA